MARIHPWALNLRVGLYNMKIRLFCVFQNHKSMPQSSPFLTPWFLWEIFLHSLTCSLWKLVWACSSILEVVSSCNKIRNKNTGKKIERKAWCQYSTARIMGFFFSRASVFVPQVKTSEHLMTYPHEETGEWDPQPSEESASLFLLILHAASGYKPECCTWMLSNAATPVHFQHNLQ